jgi:hypothetical protein
MVLVISDPASSTAPLAEQPPDGGAGTSAKHSLAFVNLQTLSQFSKLAHRRTIVRGFSA